jgi:hypothetical protein
MNSREPKSQHIIDPMLLYLLKDKDGLILGAHTDKDIIRPLFFAMKAKADLWIMILSDTTGLVESNRLFLSGSAQ